MSCLRTGPARLRSSLSSSLDIARADASRQPSGALFRPHMRESGADLQPRSRIVHQHAPLVYGVGRVLLAWPSPMCSPLWTWPDDTGHIWEARSPHLSRIHKHLKIKVSIEETA